MNPINSINWPLARRMLQCCADAYRLSTVSDAATGAQADITTTGADIVVAFRGSSEAKDWIKDAEFRREDLCWLNGDAVASVHRGFLSQFEAIDVEVVRQVRNLLGLYPGSVVFITGHSLGGALAMLCALEFQRQKIPVTGVYTFGAPRVGNQAFAEIYNRAVGDITFNLVNQGDPVPLLPTLLMGYRDCGHEVFLRRGPCGRPPVQYDPFIGWEIVLDMLGWWTAWRQFRLGMIPNHLLAAYLERMEDKS